MVKELNKKIHKIICFSLFMVFVAIIFLVLFKPKASVHGAGLNKVYFKDLVVENSSELSNVKMNFIENLNVNNYI